MLETCENHLCAMTKYEFWMLVVTFSLWFTCNCWKMSPWIKKNFLCFLRNHLELVMHVWIILEMTGCCLHLLKNSLYAQQATDGFIQEREKVQDLHYFISCLPTRTQLCFIAISSCCCNCLLAIAILLIFLELYTIVHILRSNNLTSLTSAKTFYSDILSLQYVSL
jgi:hypothetical protein